MMQTISVKTQNVPGMQKPQQNTCDCCKNTARSLTEASRRHCFFLKCAKNKSIKLVKNKNETSIYTQKT